MLKLIIISVFLGIFTIAFCVSYFKNPATILNAILFYLMLFSFSFFTLMLYSLYPASITSALFVVSAIVPFFALVLFALLGICVVPLVFFLSYRGMRKHERKGFANRLSFSIFLLFVLYIIISLCMFLPVPFWAFSAWLCGSIAAVVVFLHFFLFVSSSVICGMVPPFKNKDYVIVLGSGLVGGKVSPLLAARIDKAIVFCLKQGKKRRKAFPKLIFSGGQGSDEPMSEAEAMAQYALDKGIAEEHIIREAQATNTEENMLFSKSIIEKLQQGKAFKAAYSTNSYHVFRSGIYARQAGIPMRGLSAATKPYYAINATVREYIAYLVMFPIRHIVLLLLLAVALLGVFFVLQ